MHRIIKRGALTLLIGGVSAPVNLVAPVVTGSMTQGSTLTSTDGVWSDADTFARQWLRDGVPIGGATGSTRVATLDDALAVLTCAVTATGPGGVSAPVASTPVGPWMPTDLNLLSFLHAPWDGGAPGAAAELPRDWAVPQRVVGQQFPNAEPLYATGGDGLLWWDGSSGTRYWDVISTPIQLTRTFSVFARLKKSDENAYLMQGSGAAFTPSILSGFSLGALSWYGVVGDRYTLQAGAGDAALHTVVHVNSMTDVLGRLDGATIYNVAKTTVDYSAVKISRVYAAQSAPYKGVVRTWGILGRALTAGELATLEAWLATPKSRRTDPLTVASPAPWQTYQRALPAGTGAIPIVATLAAPYRLPGVGAQARFAGGSWVDLTVGGDGAITGSLTGISPARGTVEVRLTGPLSSTVTILKVGVGDVYIVAGQSNAMGQASAFQTSVGALGTSTLSPAYRWTGPATDPVAYSAGALDSVADNAAGVGGSPWPILGDLLNTRDAVPVAFIPCAKGATIHSQWVPGADHFDRTTLYGQMAHRAQLTGARAVLWYLGESDALGGSSAATVQGHVQTIAAAIAVDLGIPSYHAKIHSWTSGPSTVAVNTGIAAGVTLAANAYAGPDQSGVALGNIHYLTTPELTALATAWRNALP